MKKTIVFFLIGVILVSLLALGFLLGAWYSCSVGGGTLYGLTCSEIEIIGACEDLKGNIFQVPINYTTVSPFLK